MKISLHTFSLLLVFVTGLSQASSDLVDNPHFGARGWDVSLGIGAISSSDTLYQRDDDDDHYAGDGIYIPLNATWYGEKLHFTADEREGLLLGYTVLKTGTWAIDALISPRFVGPIDNDKLEDLDDRDPDLHAGLRYTLYGENSIIKLDISRDIADVHDGFIASASYEREWQLKNWILTGTVSTSHLSEKMTGYYFDVSSIEATSEFPIYSADAANITALDLTAQYPVNEDWVFKTTLTHVILDDEISDSPISTDDDSLSIITAGFLYHF